MEVIMNVQVLFCNDFAFYLRKHKIFPGNTSLYKGSCHISAHDEGDMYCLFTEYDL